MAWCFGSIPLLVWAATGAFLSAVGQTNSWASESPREIRAEVQRVAPCVSSPGRSRWAPSESRQYTAAGEYGRAATGVFKEVKTGAFRRDTLAVYDWKEGSITVLDRDLRLVRRTSPQGGRPGAFTTVLRSGVVRHHFFDVGRSAFYAYTAERRALEAYSHSGQFLGDTHLIPAGLSPDRLIGVRVAGPDLLFAVDSVAPSLGQRHVQIWAAPLHDAGVRRLVWQLSIRPPPSYGGVMIQGPGGPRPIWTLDGRCLLVSDGESEWVVRYDIGTHDTDTLPLPHYAVKAPLASAGASSSLLAALMAARGRRPQGSASASPPDAARVLRWIDMVADPDGDVWIELSRDPSDTADGIHVYRLNMVSGVVHKDVLPAFPIAFGTPGEFYAAVRDTSAGRMYVERFRLRNRR